MEAHLWLKRAKVGLGLGALKTLRPGRIWLETRRQLADTYEKHASQSELMALATCIECGGTVSDAATACPHCGHPKPGDLSHATPEPETGKRRLWPVIIWSVGFFLGGVLVNSLVGTIGIYLADDFAWELDYRNTWLWSVLPYIGAVIGGLIGLGRENRPSRFPYGKSAAALAGITVLALGVVLLGATDRSDGTSPDVIGAPQTTTTSTPESTTSTEDPTRCLTVSVAESTECDGEAPLSYLVYDYYWQDEWLPLTREIGALADKDDRAGIRVACQLAKSERQAVAQRITAWDRTELRNLSEEWFMQMELVLAACANGEWEVANAAIQLVNEQMAEACDEMRSCFIAD